jgi:hypothetical protein
MKKEISVWLLALAAYGAVIVEVSGFKSATAARGAVMTADLISIPNIAIHSGIVCRYV